MVACSAMALAGPAWAQGVPGWRALPTEPYRGKQDDISFVSPDTGWYGNGSEKMPRMSDGGLSWGPVAMGQVVNKIRVLKQGQGVCAFAIGVQVHRLDG